MLFWIICAALAVLTLLAILAPFWRRGGARGPDAPAADAPAAAYDLQVYRDQLREVERDLARKVISPEDADRLRAEIGRKVLDADRKMTAELGRGPRSRGAIAGAAMVAAALLGGGFWLYAREGAPGLRDLPLATRLAEAEQLRLNRPDQATLEADAPPAAPPDIQPEPQFLELIEQLRQAVAQNPEDPQGLRLLAQNEARLGNLDAARDAQERLIAVMGNEAGAPELTQLAALMVQAAGGIISPEAEVLLARALSADPNHPQARYLQGMLYAQNGRPDLTFRVWSALLEQSPPDAPWLVPIRSAIHDLAWIAGEPNYQPPAAFMPSAPAMPGPSAGQMADAEAMTPEDRQQMIQSMVDGLEQRLTSDGGTPEEWARLITALNVQGQTEKAAEMTEAARAAYEGQPQALSVIGAAAAPGGGQMGLDMVQRLESRLATQGGTAEEWARLIASLAEQGEQDRARAILGEARQRFAGYDDSLAAIEAAARQSGLSE